MPLLSRKQSNNNVALILIVIPFPLYRSFFPFVLFPFFLSYLVIRGETRGIKSGKKKNSPLCIKVQLHTCIPGTHRGQRVSDPPNQSCDHVGAWN